MPRKVSLTAKAVSEIVTPSRHPMGMGCYLVVDDDGGREWWVRGLTSMAAAAGPRLAMPRP
jgi:hypothetical protein